MEAWRELYKFKITASDAVLSEPELLLGLVGFSWGSCMEQHHFYSMSSVYILEKCVLKTA